MSSFMDWGHDNPPLRKVGFVETKSTCEKNDNRGAHRQARNFHTRDRFRQYCPHETLEAV